MGLLNFVFVYGLILTRFIGCPQSVHYRMGDLFDHPKLIIVAGIHDLLYLPLKLRPGVDDTVVDQVVYRDPQNIGDVDQRGQADPGRRGTGFGDFGGLRNGCGGRQNRGHFRRA